MSIITTSYAESLTKKKKEQKVIEKDLTRIAVALETIAQALTHRNDFLEANFDSLMGQAAQPNPVIQKVKEEIVDIYEKKLEAVKETPVTHDTIGTGKTVEETPAPELKFEEVSKAFFDLLNTVKKAEGLEEAKSIATELLRQYNNGKPLSSATLPKEAYTPLMAEIEKGRASYEPA